jgi:hypothetical protein
MAKKNGSRTRDRREQGQNINLEPAVQQQQIADRAYMRFCERGREPGHDVQDWLAAEQEILAAKSAR